MAISSGSRLGPYEVISPLGAGGMGEVWKARDTRLDARPRWIRCQSGGRAIIESDGRDRGLFYPPDGGKVLRWA